LLPDDHCSDAEQTAPRAPKARPRKSAVGLPRAELPEGAIVVYADGACSGNPGPAGAGVVVIDGQQLAEHSVYLGEGTNNIAELTAIEIALNAIGPTERPVRIHTDSQYSIGVLSKGWKAKANSALVARVRKRMQDFGDAELIYVPGHAGVPLNERADELAVEAVRARRSAVPPRPA
jgi:ribonuclease HI